MPPKDNINLKTSPIEITLSMKNVTYNSDLKIKILNTSIIFPILRYL